MSTVIVGGGISGLVCAAYIKQGRPVEDVVVVERPGPSNSRLAGQRYRTRVKGSSDPAVFCTTDNFEGAQPERLREFFATGASVLQDLTGSSHFAGAQDALPFRDLPEWFGPQLGRTTQDGRGIGNSVLAWLRDAALALGVRFLRGEVVALQLDPRLAVACGHFVSSEGMRQLLRAERWVVATGCPSGSLFHSTNAENPSTLMAGLVAAGCPVRDAATFMLHMAGNCDSDGRPKRGCHETDLLKGHEVFLRQGDGGFTLRNERITALLAQHKAHDHFKDIAREIIAHGGVAMYTRDGVAKFGRVMHHYSHVGLDTVDGVTVAGTHDLFAIGDACGIGYWLGSNERLPGTALLHCLVTARKCASLVAAGRAGSDRVDVQDASFALPAAPDYEPQALKDLNTTGLYAFHSGELAGCQRWLEALRALAARQRTGIDAMLSLSRTMAEACARRLTLTAAA